MADEKNLILAMNQGGLPRYVPGLLKDLGNEQYYAQATYVMGLENRDFIWQQSNNGNAFVWSSGFLPGLAVLGAFKAYISNPSTNTKTLYIYSMFIDNGGGAPITTASLLGGPTTNLPTTSRGNGTNLNFGSSNASNITLFADVVALASGLSGGTTLPSPYLPANARAQFLDDEQVIILPPGNKLGVNIPVGVGSSSSYQVALYGVVI